MIACVSSENLYLHSVDRWSWSSSYVPSISNSPQTNEQTKVFQEVTSSDVTKPNHAVTNKKQGDQMQEISLEKRLEKRKVIHHNPCQFIILVDVDGLCYKME